jgi:hypothetical protein
MDEKRLNEIKARAEAATPDLLAVGYAHDDFPDAWYVEPRHGGIICEFMDYGGADDAELFAFARPDILDLVAEVERLRAALEEIAGMVYDALIGSE